MRAVLLLAAIAWAWKPAPQGLRQYLYAQAAYTVAIYGTLLFYPETSLAYGIVFSVFTAGILLMAIGITAVICVAHPRFGTIVLSGILLAAGVSLPNLLASKSLHYYDWINIVEGTTLATLAVLLGSCGSWVVGSKRVIALSLSTLWLVQAWFRFGFQLHITSAAWLEANEWVPAWVLITALLWMGWKLRRFALVRPVSHDNRETLSEQPNRSAIEEYRQNFGRHVFLRK